MHFYIIGYYFSWFVKDILTWVSKCIILLWRENNIYIYLFLSYYSSILARGNGFKITRERQGYGLLTGHDDVIKWKHFPRNWPFVRGIDRSGEFPTQRPVTRSFDVFFDLRLNKRLSKQSWGWWIETPSWSLWRQCNVYKRVRNLG